MMGSVLSFSNEKKDIEREDLPKVTELVKSKTN